MEESLNNNYNFDLEVSKTQGEIFEKNSLNPIIETIPIKNDVIETIMVSGSLKEKSDLSKGIQFINSELIMEDENFTTNSQSDHIIKDTEEIISMTKKKRIAIIDSDSDSEEHTETVSETHSNEETDEIIPKITNNLLKKSKWAALGDSESSDDETTKENNESLTKVSGTIEEKQDNISQAKAYKRRLKSKLTSDSENENQAEVTEEIQHNEKEKETYTLGSKGELILETPNNLIQKSKWTALCDSESSEDEVTKENNENITTNRNAITEEDEDESIKPKPYKRKTKPKSSEDGPKKMTGKDVLKLRKEIQSESQRMLRETKVSLPYHKPKQFTLKEFLSRRPKLSSAVTLPIKVPPSVAIKMPKEQLVIITKKLEEREKEMKEFYKSDSGSENDDNDPEYLPEKEETNVEKVDNTTNEVNENTENLNKENENEKVTNNENKKTNDENLLNSEQNFDSGIDIQEVTSELTKDIDEQILNQYENLNFNMDVEMNISENESKHSQNVTESDSGINSTTIEKDSNPEEAEIERTAVLDTQVDNVLSSPVKQTSISEINRLAEDYEFNLNDLEESEVLGAPCESKETVEKQNTIQDISNEIDKEKSNDVLDTENEETSIDFSNEVTKIKFKDDDLDTEIEAVEVKSTEANKKLKISELLKEKLGNIKPRLSGTPDDVIDLESGVAKPKEIITLMKRFEKHITKKHVHKNKVQLNIVSVHSQGDIEKEVVSMEIDDEDSLEVEEKPGARLQRLRNELQNQIAKKKSEMWQTKFAKPGEKSTNEDDSEDKSSKSDYEDAADDILDDEDEEEMSESSEEEVIDSEEDQEEENISKKHKKSAFIDEEAEESDIEAEDSENIDDNDEPNDSDKENERVEVFEGKENSEEMKLNKKEDIVKPTRKHLRRIVKGFTEDSDDESDVMVTVKTNNEKKETEKLNEDDDMITPHQIINNQTPVKENSQQSQNGFGFDFLTPVSYITGIKNLTNSAAKHVKRSPVISPFPLPTNPSFLSPLKETDWQSSLQKKLFVESEISDSQAIANICSGEFPTTQSFNRPSDKQEDDVRQQTQDKNFTKNSDPFPSSVPSTQDLLNICSGKFTGTLQPTENSQEKESSAPENNEEILQLNESDKRRSSELDHDVIISQLLDEEEMERFKKKFESPGVSNCEKEIKENDEVNVSGILDSDDEEEDEMKVKRRKNKSKLTFSDDESSEDSEAENEEINLHDEDEIEDAEGPEPDTIEYDSEENEIEMEEDGVEEGIPKLKPSDFFDQEAELSESEWGSADEDEKDLDALEMEAGDTEKFDEKELRRDLEKIHMRRMLDEDHREIKLLQELYLEDGELHGSGRQRQFRWKNIDAFEGEEPPKTEDDVFLDEEESEEHWRKKRYEREQFLKEKQKSTNSNDDCDLLSNSQIVKIGHKVLQRSSTTSSVSLPNTPNENEEEIGVKTVMTSIFQNKRGSFLSRGEQVLQRIAEYNKVIDTEVTGAKAKNSRKFLFQTVSIEESSSLIGQDKKRKAVDGTPNVIKKLRLSDNLSPANRRKKLVDPKAKAKLF